MRQASDGRSAAKYEELLAERQKLLVDFLRAELTIASTFLRSAELAVNSEHLDHAQQAMENARRAVDSVRKLLGQVSDREASVELGTELARLEGQIG